MGLELLIPLLVPLMTEILKMVAKKFEKTAPRAMYSGSTPLTGMGLAALAGVDLGTGALLGLAGTGVYEFVSSFRKDRKGTAQKAVKGAL